ncbi:MAG: T9SS type A sorting domain-containing protein [candidate division Zixibacteria bacterium]|nr:T9SS type A sorting domain-containing protein [candidate division Zixibacteria bacterium]
MKRFTIISAIAVVLVIPALVFGAASKFAPGQAVLAEKTVTVPLEIANQDGLTAVDMVLRYSEGVTLKEVTFAGTRVEYFDLKLSHIDAAKREVIVGLINQATATRKPELSAGEGPIANLVFAVDNPSVTSITLEAITTKSPDHSLTFVYRESANGVTTFRKEQPEFGQVSLALGAGSGSSLPKEYALEQNYPNPFNPTTNIAFALPTAGRVEVAVFNVLGQQVNSLVSEDLPAGNHTIVWDGRNSQGESVASGIYFYRIVAGDFSQTKKMMMLK